MKKTESSSCVSTDAPQIVDFVMRNRPTNYVLRKQFPCLSLNQADFITRGVEAYAFGPGGRGVKWAEKQVKAVLRGRWPRISPSRFWF